VVAISKSILYKELLSKEMAFMWDFILKLLEDVERELV
jgi:hypothetical protein